MVTCLVVTLLTLIATLDHGREFGVGGLGRQGAVEDRADPVGTPLELDLEVAGPRRVRLSAMAMRARADDTMSARAAKRAQVEIRHGLGAPRQSRGGQIPVVIALVDQAGGQLLPPGSRRTGLPRS